MKTTLIDGIHSVSTGQLAEFIGFAVPVKTLTDIGLTPVGKVKAGVYWKVSDRAAILTALIDHMTKLRAEL